MECRLDHMTLTVDGLALIDFWDESGRKVSLEKPIAHPDVHRLINLLLGEYPPEGDEAGIIIPIREVA